MEYSIFVLCFVSFTFHSTLSLHEQYYWREYTGTVPVDAIIGGKTASGKNIFIGQVYMRNFGIFVVEIFGGAQHVRLPFRKKVYLIHGRSKILCGPQQNSLWISTNSTDLRFVLNTKRPVLGGHSDSFGKLSIGRVSVGKSAKIGRILSSYIKNPWMYYYDNHKEVGTKSYEILVYKKNK